MSTDATFPLGAAVTVVMIIAGVPPILTLPISFVIGGLAGMITGLIHVKLKVRDLLAGIIMMTALYSINLRIAGKANVPIFSKETIFENAFLEKVVSAELQPYMVAIILFVIVVIMKLLLDTYLKTKSGYLLRAAGDNETLVTSLAKDKGKVKIVGLAIANAFIALAGCIYAQKNGFFEITTGTGTMVIGLASVMIGTNLFKNRIKVFKKNLYIKTTTAVIIGAIIYKACVAVAISLGMKASDLKLITAVLFLGILVLSSERKRKVKTND